MQTTRRPDRETQKLAVAVVLAIVLIYLVLPDDSSTEMSPENDVPIAVGQATNRLQATRQATSKPVGPTKSVKPSKPLAALPLPEPITELPRQTLSQIVATDPFERPPATNVEDFVASSESGLEAVPEGDAENRLQRLSLVYVDADSAITLQAGKVVPIKQPESIVPQMRRQILAPEASNLE